MTKRILSFVLALVLLLGLFPIFPTQVDAAQVHVYEKTVGYVTNRDSSKIWHPNSGKLDVHLIDNNYKTPAYCIHPGTASAPGTFEAQQAELNDYWNSLTSAQRTNVIKALAYGWPADYDKNIAYGNAMSYFAATQVIIWEQCSPYTSVHDVFKLQSPCSLTLTEAYNEIKGKMDRHGKLPSFGKNSDSAASVNTMSYDVASGKYKITLTDTNTASQGGTTKSVLEWDFAELKNATLLRNNKAVDKAKYSLTRNGNKITLSVAPDVFSSKDDILTLKFEGHKRQTNATGAMIFTSKRQAIIYKDGFDPQSVYVKFKREEPSFELLKTSTKGPIKDWKFVIENQTTGKTWYGKTNANGVAERYSDNTFSKKVSAGWVGFTDGKYVISEYATETPTSGANSYAHQYKTTYVTIQTHTISTTKYTGSSNGIGLTLATNGNSILTTANPIKGISGSGGFLKVVFNNEPIDKFSLTKTSDDGNVQGYCFKITAPDGKVYYGKTDANGKMWQKQSDYAAALSQPWQNLPNGVYTIVEDLQASGNDRINNVKPTKITVKTKSSTTTIQGDDITAVSNGYQFKVTLNNLRGKDEFVNITVKNESIIKFSLKKTVDSGSQAGYCFKIEKMSGSSASNPGSVTATWYGKTDTAGTLKRTDSSYNASDAKWTGFTNGVYRITEDLVKGGQKDIMKPSEIKIVTKTKTYTFGSDKITKLSNGNYQLITDSLEGITERNGKMAISVKNISIPDFELRKTSTNGPIKDWKFVLKNTTTNMTWYGKTDANGIAQRYTDNTYTTVHPDGWVGFTNGKYTITEMMTTSPDTTTPYAHQYKTTYVTIETKTLSKTTYKTVANGVGLATYNNGNTNLTTPDLTGIEGAGGKFKIVFNNEPEEKLKLQKTSDTGSVEGYCFQIKAPDGKTYYGKTDATGKLLPTNSSYSASATIWQNLPNGEYTITEDLQASGKINNEYPEQVVITTQDGSTTITKENITSVAKGYQFKITLNNLRAKNAYVTINVTNKSFIKFSLKKTVDEGTLDGYKFKILAPNGTTYYGKTTSAGELIRTNSSYGNSNLKWTGFTDGVYTITEDLVASGKAGIVKPSKFTIKTNGHTYTYTGSQIVAESNGNYKVTTASMAGITSRDGKIAITVDNVSIPNFELIKTSTNGPIKDWKFVIKNTTTGRTWYGKTDANGVAQRYTNDTYTTLDTDGWIGFTDGKYTITEMITESPATSNSYANQYYTTYVTIETSTVPTTKYTTLASGVGLSFMSNGNSTLTTSSLTGISNGGHFKVVFNNEPEEKLKLQKTSDTGSVEGYCFQIKAPDGKTYYGKTDATGKLLPTNSSYSASATIWQNLPNGKYTIIEDLQASGKINDERPTQVVITTQAETITLGSDSISTHTKGYSFEVTLNNLRDKDAFVTINVKNQSIMKFSLKKTTDFGTPDGYCFKIEKMSGSSASNPGNVVKTWYGKTDATGALQPTNSSYQSSDSMKFTGFTNGVYRITEDMVKSNKTGVVKPTQLKITTNTQTYTYTFTESSSNYVAVTESMTGIADRNGKIEMTVNNTGIPNFNLQKSSTVATYTVTPPSATLIKTLNFTDNDWTYGDNIVDGDKREWTLHISPSAKVLDTDALLITCELNQVDYQNTPHTCTTNTSGFVTEITWKFPNGQSYDNNGTLTYESPTPDGGGNVVTHQITNAIIAKTGTDAYQYQALDIPASWQVPPVGYTLTSEAGDWAGQNVQSWVTSVKTNDAGYVTTIFINGPTVSESESYNDDIQVTITYTQGASVEVVPASLAGYCFKIEEMQKNGNNYTVVNTYYGKTNANGELLQTNASYTSAVNNGVFPRIKDGYYSITEDLAASGKAYIEYTNQFGIQTANLNQTWTNDDLIPYDANGTGFMKMTNGNYCIRNIKLTGVGGKNGFLTVTAENAPFLNFTLKKVNNSGASVQGFRFVIEQVNASNQVIKTWEGITDASGNLVEINGNPLYGFSNGRYRITEYIPKSTNLHLESISLATSTKVVSYNLNELTKSSNSENDIYTTPVTILDGINVDNGYLHVEADNEPTIETPKITITKYITGISGTNSLLSGWTFKIYSTKPTSSTINSMTPVVTFTTTGTNGKTVYTDDSHKLTIGNTYWIVETQKPGYICDSMIDGLPMKSIVIHEGANTISFTNTPTYPVIIKKTSDSITDKSGFKIILSGITAPNDTSATNFYGVSAANGNVVSTTNSFSPTPSATANATEFGPFINNGLTLAEVMSENTKLTKITVQRQRGSNITTLLTYGADDLETLTSYAGVSGDIRLLALSNLNNLLPGDKIIITFNNETTVVPISLRKTIDEFSPDAIPLANWKFNILTPDGEIVLTGVSDVSGNVVFDTDAKLQPGTYIIEEVGYVGSDGWAEVLANYKPSTTTQEITVTTEGPNEFTFANIRRKDATMLKIVTDDRQSVAGFKFILENTTTHEKWYGITTESGYAVPTDSNWKPTKMSSDRGKADIYTFDGLTNGTYQFTEIIDDNITNGGKNIIILSKPKTVHIYTTENYFIKQSDYSANVLNIPATAKIQKIYDINGTDTSTWPDTQFVKTNGFITQVQFENIILPKDGVLTFTSTSRNHLDITSPMTATNETTYTSNDFTVSAANNWDHLVIEITNEPIPTKLTIKKQIPNHPATDALLNNWQFSITDSRGHTKLVSTGTDGSGTILITNMDDADDFLVAGEIYIIKEIVRDGFIPETEEQRIKLSENSDENVVTFINHAPVPITIRKEIFEDDNAPSTITENSPLLANWRFNVKTLDGTILLTGKTDETGKVIFDNNEDTLYPGTYILEEVGYEGNGYWAEVFADYKPENSGVQITVTETGDNVFTFRNRRVKDAQMSKIIDDERVAKDGFKFILTNTTTGQKWYGISTESGSIIKTNSAWEPDTTGSPFLFNDVTNGTYTITEIIDSDAVIPTTAKQAHIYTSRNYFIIPQDYRTAGSTHGWFDTIDIDLSAKVEKFLTWNGGSFPYTSFAKSGNFITAITNIKTQDDEFAVLTYTSSAANMLDTTITMTAQNATTYVSAPFQLTSAYDWDHLFIDVTNETIPTSLTIRKEIPTKPAPNADLNGWQFTITDSTGAVQIVTTPNDGSGVLHIDNLIAGETYIIKETVRDGYIPEMEEQIIILSTNSDENVVTFINHGPVPITVTKIIDGIPHGIPLSQWQFTISKPDGTVLLTGMSDENGRVHFDNDGLIYPGVYILSEIGWYCDTYEMQQDWEKVLEDYMPDDTGKEIVVTEEGPNEFTFTNIRRKDVELNKLVTDDRLNPTGIKFILTNITTNQNWYGITKQDGSILQTDSNWVAFNDANPYLFRNMPDGTYVLTEILPDTSSRMPSKPTQVHIYTTENYYVSAHDYHVGGGGFDSILLDPDAQIEKIVNWDIFPYISEWGENRFRRNADGFIVAITGLLTSDDRYSVLQYSSTARNHLDTTVSLTQQDETTYVSQPFTVSAANNWDHMFIDITNTTIPTSLTIVKQIPGRPAPNNDLNGWSFVITDSRGNTQTVTTANDGTGRIVVPNLIAGETYIVREIVKPSFAPDMEEQDITLKINAGENVLTFLNRAPATLAMKKQAVAPMETNRVAGFKFKLENTAFNADAYALTQTSTWTKIDLEANAIYIPNDATDIQATTGDIDLDDGIVATITATPDTNNNGYIDYLVIETIEDDSIQKWNVKWHTIYYGVSDDAGNVYQTNAAFGNVEQSNRVYNIPYMYDGSYNITEILSDADKAEKMYVKSVDIIITNRDNEQTTYHYDEEDIELDENGNPILKDVAIVDSRGGTISIVVNNSVRKAPFQILKVLAPEAPAPHNASGWEFYVCTTNDPDADPIYTGVTNEDGIVVFDGYTLDNPPLVVEGTHLYIFERGYVGTDTYIQSHYKPSTEPVDITIHENITNEVTYVNHAYGTFRLYKEYDGTHDLDGFCVKIEGDGHIWYGKSDAEGKFYETNAEYADVAEADRNYVFYGMDEYKTYTITEILSRTPDSSLKSVRVNYDYSSEGEGEEPDVYTFTGSQISVADNKDSSITIELGDNVLGHNIDITLTNGVTEGSIEIIKYAGDGTTTPIPGVVFGLYTPDGTKIAEQTTNAQGKATFEGLTEGDYKFRELSVPSYITLDPTMKDIHVTGGTVVTKEVHNDWTLIDIEIDKTNPTGGKLQDVEFVLEYTTDDGAHWNAITTRSATAIPTVGTTTTTVAAGGMVKTDANGHAEYKQLMPIDPATGNYIRYRLREVKTQNGFQLPPAPIFDQVFDREHGLNINENGEVTGSLTFNYHVVNQKTVGLPSTGGNGVMLPVILGTSIFSLLLIAAFLLMRRRRHSEN